jgi:hypothetical protein
MHSAAPGTIGASLCGLGSNWVTKVWLSFPSSSRSDSLSSYSLVMCQIKALPFGLRYLRRVNVLACVTRSLGAIVVSAARKGGPLTNFFGQSMVGLNSRNHGYQSIIQSHPRSTMRNLSIRALPPWNTATGNQYFTILPRLSVPSMFLIPIGLGSSLGLIPSFCAVLMSIQFSLAPQSTNAFSATIPHRVTKSSGIQISLATKLMYTISGGCTRAKVGAAERVKNPVG